MTNKDKERIKELEEEKDNLQGWAIVFGLILFVIVIIIGVTNPAGDIKELKQELQSCQEKIPVWTLKLNCRNFSESIEANIIMKFNSYDEYKSDLDKVLEEENCEVIK